MHVEVVSEQQQKLRLAAFDNVMTWSDACAPGQTVCRSQSLPLTARHSVQLMPKDRLVMFAGWCGARLVRLCLPDNLVPVQVSSNLGRPIGWNLEVFQQQQQQ